MCRCQIRKLMYILNHDHYIALVMITGRETMSIALLKPLNLVGEFNGFGEDRPSAASVQMSPPRYNKELGLIYPEITNLLTTV